MREMYVKCECCSLKCFNKENVWKEFVCIQENGKIIPPVERKYPLFERMFRSHLEEPDITNLKQLWMSEYHFCRSCYTAAVVGRRILPEEEK